MKVPQNGVMSHEVLDGSEVKEYLEEMLADARTRNIDIASPYIKKQKIQEIFTEVILKKGTKKRSIDIRILVSLDIDNFVHQASDLEAIDEILNLIGKNSKCHISLRSLDKLHAKVYACDWSAIVGSANFTYNGLEGVNYEAALIVHGAKEISSVRQKFNALWKLGRTINQENWVEIRATIKKAQDDCQIELRKIHDIIRKNHVALERIPNEQKRAEYYDGLLGNLRRINESSRRALKKETIIQNLRKHGKNRVIKPELAEKRFGFLNEIGLIESHGGLWRASSLGAQLDIKYESRIDVFRKLLEWCEERNDYQFAVLLKGLENNFARHGTQISLKDWYHNIPVSERNRYWINPYLSEDEAYEKFVKRSCIARNWLISLCLVQKIKNKFEYCRGDLYERYLSEIQSDIDEQAFQYEVS